MSEKRKTYSSVEKAKIALEALKGELTMAQLTTKYGCHITQINNWKNQLKEGITDIFKDRRRSDIDDRDKLIEELYKKVGQLNIELDWLKKKSALFD